MNPWGKLLLQIGVPSAIALYLVWLLGGQMLTAVQANTSTLASHVVASERLAATLDEQKQDQRIIIDLMRQLCINTAHTAGDRAVCFDSRR